MGAAGVALSFTECSTNYARRCVVWTLDRLSRSLKDLPHLLDRIETTNAGFRSLTESIDTTTPAGRMMMQMVGSFAEFERAMIRERTKAGLVPPGTAAGPRHDVRQRTL